MSHINGKRDACKTPDDKPHVPLVKVTGANQRSNVDFDVQDEHTHLLDKITDAMESVLSRVQTNAAVENSMKQWADSNGIQECVDFRDSYYCGHMDSFLASTFKRQRAIQSAIHDDLQMFIIDSGCTTHCISDFSLFTNIVDDSPSIKVRVANAKFVKVEAVGDVSLHVTDDNGKSRVITLKNAFYTPDIPPNLISTKMLFSDSDITTTLTDRCVLSWPDGDALDVSCKGKHYMLPARVNHMESEAFSVGTVSGISSSVIHSRLGHPGVDRAVQALRTSKGLPDNKDFRRELQAVCDSCARGGARLKSFRSRKPENAFTYFGQRVQSDMCGPFPCSITKGFYYILSFVDSCTGLLNIYFLEDKTSESILKCLKLYQNTHAARLPAQKVELWFTDNGGEFASDDMFEFCDEFAIKRGFTVPFGSPQNGQAERLWVVLQRCMRIVLVESGLPDSFWHYAAQQACWLYNHLPTKHNVDSKSPQETYDGMVPDFSKIRVFGCKCYVASRNKIGSLDRPTRVSPTAMRAVHLGRDPARNGWIVYIPELRRITTSLDVTFDESTFLRVDARGVLLESDPEEVENGTFSCPACSGKHEKHTCGKQDSVVRSYLEPRSARSNAPIVPTIAPHVPNAVETDAGQGHLNADEPAVQRRVGEYLEYEVGDCGTPGCSLRDGHIGPHSTETINQRTRSEPFAGVVQSDEDDYLDPFTSLMYCDISSAEFKSAEAWAVNINAAGRIHIPDSYDEAMASRFSKQWIAAMDREIKELLAKNTWTCTDLPTARKNTKSRWVFTVKYKHDGTVDRFKARFVCCGYSQVQGVDYESSFSSTMRATTFRSLMAIASVEKLFAEHVDVSNAFCQAELDKFEIYVDAPRGYENICGAGKSLRLLRALYGTKQASYLWQQTLSKYLISVGFKRMKTDPCVFEFRSGDITILIGVYVDDLVVLHNSKKYFWSFLNKFMERFEAKYMGALEWFLGIHVQRDSDFSVSLNQTKYVQDLMDKFFPNSEATTVQRNIPYPVEKCKTLGLATDDAEIERMRTLPYLQLVGSLLYLSTMTRPDISYITGVLCQFMSSPSLQCFEAAQSVLLYCGKTSELKIHYRGGHKFHVPDALLAASPDITNKYGLHAYSDSSWNLPKSTYGYCVFAAGGLISYCSRKNNVIADSSALAEYSGVSAATKELLFDRNLFNETGRTVSGPIVLGVDNTASISIAEKEGVTKLTKHFDFAVNRVRDEVSCLRVRLLYVPTTEMTADIFTKPLDAATFLRLRERLVTKALNTKVTLRSSGGI